MAKGSGYRPQAGKPHVMQTAKSRQIFAVRREISPESHPVFRTIMHELKSETKGVARLFDVESLGVTVIGFSRFNSKHRSRGPSSLEIIRQVPSSRDYLAMCLGDIGVFGSGNKYKLGFRLTNSQFGEEVEAFEAIFNATGYPLKADYNNPLGQPLAHCSVALLDNDKVATFQNDTTLHILQAFDGICSAIEQTVLLEPVRLANE